MTQGTSTSRPFPRFLALLGIPFSVIAALLAIRLIWEQTVLTWEQGPQMVGWSLMHDEVGVVALVALWISFLWIVPTLVMGIVRRGFGGRLGTVVVSLYATSVLALLVPYSWWQLAFTSKLAHSPHAADFLTVAAGGGHEANVKALLSSGVPVDAESYSGSTALHSAASTGQLGVCRLLLEQGADINKINRSGDSPLAYAESQGRTAVADFLRAHGAKSIRGTVDLR